MTHACRPTRFGDVDDAGGTRPLQHTVDPHRGRVDGGRLAVVEAFVGVSANDEAVQHAGGLPQLFERRRLHTGDWRARLSAGQHSEQREQGTQAASLVDRHHETVAELATALPAHLVKSAAALLVVTNHSQTRRLD